VEDLNASTTLPVVRCSSGKGARTLSPLILPVALFHPWQCLRYSLEQQLDIMSKLCARLNKHEIVLASLFCALRLCDFTLVCKIGFIADEDDDNVVTTFATDIVDPFSRLLERLCIYVRVRKMSEIGCLNQGRRGAG
jgi:hypothetical protein